MRTELPSPLPQHLVVARLRERTSDRIALLASFFPDDSRALGSVDASSFRLESVPTSIVSYNPLAACSGDIEAEGSGSRIRFRTRPTWNAIFTIGFGSLFAAIGVLSGAAVSLRADRGLVPAIAALGCGASGGCIAYLTLRGTRREQAQLVATLCEAGGVTDGAG